MKVTIKVTQSFKKQAKPLLKKFPSLFDELQMLENKLIENPKLGTSIGNSTYKIRLSSKSKGKGKSGGFRVISYLETEIIGLIDQNEDIVTVYLITIYDKSETSSISNKELKELISNIQHP